MPSYHTSISRTKDLPKRIFRIRTLHCVVYDDFLLASRTVALMIVAVGTTLPRR